MTEQNLSSKIAAVLTSNDPETIRKFLIKNPIDVLMGQNVPYALIVEAINQSDINAPFTTDRENWPQPYEETTNKSYLGKDLR